MITMNMTKKREVRITDKHFSLENNILTLEINIGDYDITGKQITAVLEPKGIETAPLTAETVEGVTTVSLPIYSSYIAEGVNYIQLYFRWADTKLEQSGKMMWVVERSLIADDPGVEQQDLMSYYLQQMVLAIAEADRVVDEAGDVRVELDVSTGNATAINNTLADPATGTIKLATDANATLSQSIVDAGIAKDALTDPVTGAIALAEAAEDALTNPTTGAIKLAEDAEDSLQAVIDNSQIGNLASLTTTEKSTLVGAINEVDSDLATHKEDYANQVGSVANLATTSKEVVGSINELNTKKADKQQEAWITPTLLNGATTDENNSLQYRKNDFGVVEFKGVLIAGASGQRQLNLPVGYKPITAKYRIVVVTTDDVIDRLNISDGSFYHRVQLAGKEINMTGISFPTI